jgi:hypothetical protein
MEKDRPFHKGARVALNIVGVLLILLVFTAPFGLWMFWRVSKARLRTSAKGVDASSITNIAFDYDDVARLGVCRIPIRAVGIAGALAKYKVGGDVGINVCAILRDGKKKQITANLYEDYEAAMDEISKGVGKPYEELEMGAFGVKWPEAKAAA